MSVTDDGL